MAVKQLYPNQRPTLNLNFARSKALDPRITFTRNSTATYVGSDGLIKTVVAGEARFDHDPVTGECLGLLIEEGRTNSFEYSEDFSQTTHWDPVNSIVTFHATEVAPDGSTGVYATQPNSASKRYQWLTVENNPTHSNPNCVSVFAKANGYDYFFIHMSAEDAAVFNLDTGTIESTFSGNTAWIEDFGNGWYRCSVVHNTAKSGTNWGIGCRPTANDAVFASDGSSVLIWGAQWEDNKTFPTSYIPTSGSTFQRIVEEVSITGTNFSSWYNGSEGTMVMNMIRKPVYSSGAYLEFYNNAGFFLQDISTDFHMRIGAANGSVTLGQFATTTNYRIAAAYTSAVDFKASVNGGNTSAAITTSVNFNNATELHIGRGNNAFAAHWRNGPTTFTLRNFAFYPTRLSDSQLKELTL